MNRPILAALAALLKPGVTVEYEGVTYGFCSEANQKKFQEERAASLYQQIGGKAALSAAVDLFYVKVLADKRVNHFFEDVNMKSQHEKQKAFLAAALGAPTPWTGKDMRKAPADRCPSFCASLTQPRDT